MLSEGAVMNMGFGFRDMGGCQNYGPFLGTLYVKVPYYNSRDAKREDESKLWSLFGVPYMLGAVL